MTYNVFSGMLNPTQSINHVDSKILVSDFGDVFCCEFN